MAAQTMPVNNSRVLEVNDWPTELENKLRKLEDGEVVKVRINPSNFRTVFRQIMEDNKVKSSGNVKMIGEHGIKSPWTIRFGKKPIQVGLLSHYDANTGAPVFASCIADPKGEITFRADRWGDSEKFMALQLHPQMKIDPLTGADRKNWKWEIVDVENEGEQYAKNFDKRLALMNKIASLSDWQLNVLMGADTCERMFYHQMDKAGKPKASKAFLASKLDKGEIKDVEAKLKMLSEVEDIKLIEQGLASAKLFSTEAVLSRFDGKEIGHYATPITVSSHGDVAIAIYKNSVAWPEFRKDVIEWLTEDAQSTEGGSRKLKGK